MTSKTALTVPAAANRSPLAAKAIAFAKAHTTWASGMCEQFVREALGQDAKYLTAAAEWTAALAPVDHTHTWYRHPVGVPVHFHTHSSAGHVALGDVYPYVWSTDMAADGTYAPGHVSRVTIAQVERAMGASYEGWLDTCEGVSVYHS